MEIKDSTADRFPAKFSPNERVRKIGGKYGGPGRITAVHLADETGYRLYSVAMRSDPLPLIE